MSNETLDPVLYARVKGQSPGPPSNKLCYFNEGGSLSPCRFLERHFYGAACRKHECAKGIWCVCKVAVRNALTQLLKQVPPEQHTVKTKFLGCITHKADLTNEMLGYQQMDDAPLPCLCW